MKRFLLLLSVALLTGTIFTGCSKTIPVKEKLTNYNDNSTVYMPFVKTSNPGLDEQINNSIKIELEDNFTAVKRDREGSTTEGFTAFQSGDLLTIMQEGYFEPKGSQEGDSYLYSFHINVRNGFFYKLDDLFLPGYEQELSQIVADMLDAQLGEYYLTHAPYLGNTPFDAFNNEIIFIFNPETVAPKHLGFIDVVIPFNKIDHLFNKNGEFYQVVQKSNSN